MYHMNGALRFIIPPDFKPKTNSIRCAMLQMEQIFLLWPLNHFGVNAHVCVCERALR